MFPPRDGRDGAILRLAGDPEEEEEDGVSVFFAFGSGPTVTIRSRPSTSMFVMLRPEGEPSHQRLSGLEESLKTTRFGG